jgi:NAD(P)H-dependent FMN reductase
MTTISVIVGSTREGRFSEKPARWILQHLRKRQGVDARLLDLRDFPMPFFDQPAPPAMPGRPPYMNEVVRNWTAAIARSDGFVFVIPEYNYGPSAVLKNAIDWVYPEWNRKAAAFVSYGSAMGARSVPQLREIAIELQLAPIRSSVHIPVATLWAHYKGGDVDTGLAELEVPAGTMIDDLLWLDHGPEDGACQRVLIARCAAARISLSLRAKRSNLHPVSHCDGDCRASPRA